MSFSFCSNSMAEADPETSSSSDPRPNNPTKRISVLLLATRWTFDTFGLSTVNKSLVNNLRLVDPDGQTIKITCAVLEENDKISEDEIEDAAIYGVELKGAKQRRGKKSPCIEWMEESTASYYRDLVIENKFDYIVYVYVLLLTGGVVQIHETSSQAPPPTSPRQQLLYRDPFPITAQALNWHDKKKVNL